ncbi:N-acetylglucosamine-6-phosphate deacetylase [Pseudocolwellia sp. AS88]|uniref:N-acetylglucosamine-6-phosphate deacetylase n=1 Tax=Pseudocolwellia sp. AS88 TaxID=3063958 RepID=UPI0026EF635E|nr:N-acetylglucosamine-6-phosphate deacetylase [Pseudocolwellia sp. AS88]MDO7085241.1 N-acetylglucosamine-6-phosphate deacetylase [Pseudocolwellia sp. AS88]
MRYFAQRLFDGLVFKSNQVITVKNQKIVSVEQGTADEADTLLSGLVAPGFIDVQVNGGGGKLFNNEPNLATLETMSRAHQTFGTTAMLPTLITDNLATMTLAANAVALALTNKIPGIIGIHFEGPHLSSPKKGIHPESHIRPISEKELALFKRKDLGVVCVTLAPENVSCDVIKELVSSGVKICLGHSNASVEQTLAAIDAGATGFTHLYNAMSPLTSRAAGMVGAALLRDEAYCGLIVDHEHVDKVSCQLAIKCKTSEKIMLVTDAMSHVGSNQTLLTFAGMEISRTGNKLTIEGGRLAGSALDMATAVRNTVTNLDTPLDQTLQIASSTPAKFVELQNTKGQLSEGYDADWIVLTDDLHVTQTYIGGKQVFSV